MSELRECPFCGATPEMFPEGSERAMAQVDCTNQACALRPSVMSPTIADAVYFWNSRPSPWRTGKPEEEGDYLVSGEQDSVFLVAVWMDGNWWTPYPFPSEEIKFWMKVPRLPDKGEKP